MVYVLWNVYSNLFVTVCQIVIENYICTYCRIKKLLYVENVTCKVYPKPTQIIKHVTYFMYVESYIHLHKYSETHKNQQDTNIYRLTLLKWFV